MSTHEATVCRCPHCGHKFDRATNAQSSENGGASPGDALICINCERVLIFRDDLTLRAAEPDELVEAMPFIMRALLALRIIKKMPTFTCPDCQRTSYNPNDVRERYCGACHKFF